MNTHVKSAAQHPRHMAFAGPDCFQPCLSTSAEVFGSAPITAMTPKSAAMLRLGWELSDLRREAARLRNLRRMRQASLIEAESRRVVFEILALGKA